MNPPSEQFYILVRPPGSHIWTMHMRPSNVSTQTVPAVFFNAEKADNEAVKLAINSRYCTLVIRAAVPAEPDTAQTARLSNNDTTFFCTIDNQ